MKNVPPPKTDAVLNEQTSRFLHDLSDLCRKYGIGITGNPTLFLMERDDYNIDYVADSESKLSLG